jgi:ABC-2 type transport system ATP-binding protein
MELTVENVKKTFGEKVALDIGTYVIHDGEIVGLVGNNGAGKTTLFRIILDLIRPDSGVVRIGAVATAHSEDWKQYTGAYIDSSFLIDYLTPEEYFELVGSINNIPAPLLKERLSAFDHFMNGEVVGRKVLIRNLSAGNKQKVGIIAAMLHQPQMLILDEPFNFLDPSSQHAIKYHLERYHRETGATILISSHNLSHTFDISTRITLLEHGNIIRDQNKDCESLATEIEEYFIHHS